MHLTGCPIDGVHFCVDWRYGAARFEEQLIDYDAAVSWGKWLYIAGVDADQRGGRHFNLEKQTMLYDPDSRYQKRWSQLGDKSNLSNQPLDSFDAVDWLKISANSYDE